MGKYIEIFFSEEKIWNDAFIKKSYINNININESINKEEE